MLRTGHQDPQKVDTTQTSSWDDWAQGFSGHDGKSQHELSGPTAPDIDHGSGDLFFFSLYNQPMWLD